MKPLAMVIFRRLPMSKMPLAAGPLDSVDDRVKPFMSMVTPLVLMSIASPELTVMLVVK
jgi:hypothetical protein